MATVLVIGASKGIGFETVKQALAAGHSVRALSRTKPDIADPRLEIISGDAQDRATLENAVAGADVVIQSLGAALTWQPVTLFSKSTRGLVDAMKAKGIRRLVVVTGMGAGDSRGVGPLIYTHLFFPLLLKPIYDDKDVQERIIRDSGLDWTIARPGGLTSGPATGRYQVITDPKSWRGGFISRRDVADFLVRQIEDRSLIGATPLLIG